jgi:hypothetical protein
VVSKKWTRVKQFWIIRKLVRGICGRSMLRPYVREVRGDPTPLRPYVREVRGERV